MCDYIITLKVRCRKRTVNQEIERIFKTGRFQESLEFNLSEHITDRLRLAYVDVSEVDVSAKFSKKRVAGKKPVAAAAHNDPALPPKPVAKKVGVK